MNDLIANSSMDDPVAGLIARVIDGRLDDSERIELLNRLHKDVAARQRYLDHLLLHAMLGKELTNLSPDNLGSLEVGLHELPQPIVAAPRRTISPLATACSITLVATLFYGAFFVLSHNLRDKQNLAKRNAPSTGEPVATIRDESDVQWSSLTPASTQGEVAAITAGQPLSIQSGLIELQLNGGTTLLIEGPAEWSIDGENHAKLKRGKLHATVPLQAHGFVLDTPTTRVVDLGTEFGIEVGDQTEYVAVFQGIVQLQPLSSGAPHPESISPVTLSAGESRQLTTDLKTGVWRSEETASKVRFTRETRPTGSLGFSTLSKDLMIIEDSGPLAFRGVANAHFEPANDDLLQSALDVQHPHKPVAGTKGKFEGQFVEDLINGRLYSPSISSPHTQTFDSYSSTDGQPIEYYFNCANAPHGFDIERIETITGWVGSRLGQKYLVFVRQKGKTRFENAPAISVNLPSVESGDAERKVVVRGKNGEPLATGVDAVSFMLIDRPDGLHTDVYREIDVMGQPTQVRSNSTRQLTTPANSE